MPPNTWTDPPTYGIPDPQAQLPLCRCAQCGREIYPGGDYLTDTPAAPESPGATTLHRDCLADWVRDLGPTALSEAFGFHTPNKGFALAGDPSR